ncbi:MAG TPA: hypothetical protein VMY88_07000, partial [Acidimicrobiales bacterium]|nr:hypothetical protein [Acidimicrobiales bacterium]
MSVLRTFGPRSNRGPHLTLATGVLGCLQIATASSAGAVIPNPVNIITNPVGDLVGGAVGWGFDKVAEGIAGWVLGAVGF